MTSKNIAASEQQQLKLFRLRYLWPESSGHHYSARRSVIVFETWSRNNRKPGPDLSDSSFFAFLTALAEKHPVYLVAIAGERPLQLSLHLALRVLIDRNLTPLSLFGGIISLLGVLA